MAPIWALTHDGREALRKATDYNKRQNKETGRPKSQPGLPGSFDLKTGSTFPNRQDLQITTPGSLATCVRRHSSSRSIAFLHQSQEKQRQRKHTSPRRRSGSSPCATDEQACSLAFVHLIIFFPGWPTGASWHKGAPAIAARFSEPQCHTGAIPSW